MANQIVWVLEPCEFGLEVIPHANMVHRGPDDPDFHSCCLPRYRAVSESVVSYITIASVWLGARAVEVCEMSCG